MFAVYLEGRGGGCDYTIACNQKLVYLPAEIQTMKEAEEYVTRGVPKITDEDLFSDYGDGQLNYFDDWQDQIKSATILEIKDEAEIDLDSLILEINLNKKEAEFIKQKQHDEADYERLKKKLGK